MQIVVKNGVTQPVFDCKESIFEKVYVETPVDTDGDGKRDLVAAYVRRPAETQQGLKVPVIYVANPYMMECNEDWYQLCDVDCELSGETSWEEAGDGFALTGKAGAELGQPKSGAAPAVRVPKGKADRADTEEIPLDCITDWYHYFLSRGYALVFCAGLGTKGSEGFNCAGSSEETAAFAAVIDWLCGRVNAYTDKENDVAIEAHWSAGKVAMSGKSYLGTMCIALATAGIEGLETVIPEAAISDWYGYFRQNGLAVACEGWQGDDIHLLTRYCFSRRLDKEDYSQVETQYLNHLAKIERQADRVSGNRNLFWDERNYRDKANRIKASVYLVQGLNDWNVKPDQCLLFWQELKRWGVPSKMMLHQGEHIYIYNQETIDFTGIMHKWLDHWLHGLDNGVMEEVPDVLVQSNLNQALWQESGQWPPEGTDVTRLKPALRNNSFCDDLSLTPFDREKNNLDQWRDAVMGEVEKEQPYRTGALLLQPDRDVRISGAVTVKCRLAVDADAAVFSAALVDEGSGKRLAARTEIVTKDGMALGLHGKTADVVCFAEESEPSSYKVITRGWMDVRNRSGDDHKEPVVPGRFYDLELNLIPLDHTLQAGHKLMLVIYGSDAEYTVRPRTAVTVEIEAGSLEVLLPVCPSVGQGTADAEE